MSHEIHLRLMVVVVDTGQLDVPVVRLSEHTAFGVQLRSLLPYHLEKRTGGIE